MYVPTTTPFVHNQFFQSAQLKIVSNARQGNKSIVDGIARVVYVRFRKHKGTDDVWLQLFFRLLIARHGEEIGHSRGLFLNPTVCLNSNKGGRHSLCFQLHVKCLGWRQVMRRKLASCPTHRLVSYQEVPVCTDERATVCAVVALLQPNGTKAQTPVSA